MKFLRKMNLSIWIKRSIKLGLSVKSIIILIALSIVTTVMEVFGVSMFLPIFQYIRLDGDIDALTENMEIWHQVISWFDFFGLGISLTGLLVISFSLFIVRQIFSYTHMIYSVFIRENIIQIQRNKLFSKYLNSSSWLHDDLPVGDLVNITINEVTKSVNGVMAPIGLAVHFIMSFGYLVNKLGGEYLISERGQSLIRASYNCIN